MIALVSLLFAVFVVTGTIIILFTKNVVHAVYALALTVVGIAAIYVLLNAELIAVVQILIYGGGVVILMAFGIMMSARPQAAKIVSETKNRLLGGVIAAIAFVLLLVAFSAIEPKDEHDASLNQVQAIGKSFLLDHLVAFELIAFVLLVTLVGAGYLAKTADD